MAAVNFFQPGTDAAVDAGQIQRQRAMAELLMKQGQTTPQGSMVSGHYVAPGAGAYVAQLAQALAGGYRGQKADADEKQLVKDTQMKRAQEANDFMSAINGSPGKDISPLTPNDDEGNPMPTVRGPAVAPDRSKALALALQSQNPALQTMGGELMKTQMADQRRQQILSQFGIGGASGAPGAGGAAAGGSPGMSGMDPRVIGLLSSGDPALEKMATMLQESNKPIPLREGDLVVPDGQGGFKSAYTQPKLDAGMQPVRDSRGGLLGARAIPGYDQGIASITGAKANATQGAESANTMVTVDTRDGPRMMTRAQALQLSSGAPQAAPVTPQPAIPAQPLPPGLVGNGAGPVNGQAIRNPMAPQPGDTDRVAIFSQERNNIAKRIQAAQQSGDQAELQRAQSDAVGLEKEIKSSKVPLPPMPIPGVSAPMPQQQPQQAPGIALQDDSSKKFGQTIATQSADALVAGRDKAKNAADDLLSVNQARAAIKGGSFQGSGADTKLAIAKFVNANIPGVTVDAEKVGNTDYLKSTLGAGVLAQAKSLGANPSNADAERINDIVGSIGKDPNAMNRLLDWRETMSKRAIDNHNKTVGDAEQRGMKSPYDLRVNPQSAAPAAGGGFKIIGVQ